MSELSHIDKEGRARMVDVGDKHISEREAIAQSRVILPSSVMAQVKGNDLILKKGSITEVARIAGIMGAKRTSELIPMCHPIALDHLEIDTSFQEGELLIRCTARCSGKTGVEMEALTGASIAALTVYDMCKAVSHEIVIADTRLIKKTGGKSDYDAEEAR